MSGELYAPRVPVIPENQEMKLLVDTYGKTWHFWQIDRGDKLPFGELHHLSCKPLLKGCLIRSCDGPQITAHIWDRETDSQVAVPPI